MVLTVLKIPTQFRSH